MKSNTLKSTCTCALMAALLCVVSPIAIPIGPVPISLSLFAVLLISALMGPIKAVASIMLYLALGAIGLPVFGGGMAGFGVLIGPTGGFLWSYLPICVLSGGIYRIAWRRQQWRSRLIFGTLAGFCGLILCYLLGALQYMAVANVTMLAALAVCVLPFVLIDLAKIVLVCLLVERLLCISSVRRAFME